MSEFKIGDRVRVIGNDCFYGLVGRVIAENNYVKVLFNDGQNDYFDTADLTKDKTSFNTLLVGDIVTDEDGDERKVLEVGVNSFLPSCRDGVTASTFWYSFIEAINNGWKVKGQEEDKNGFQRMIDEVKAVERMDIIKRQEKKELDDATQEAIELLKNNGYKIIKENE